LAQNNAMAQPETVAYLLEELHSAGVTYQKVADTIGVTWMTVHRWAYGTSHPRPALPVNVELSRLLIGEHMAADVKTHHQTEPALTDLTR